MPTAHIHRLRDLLVHDHADLHARFRFALQQPIQAPFGEIRCGTSEVEFGTEPPIEDEDALLGRVDQLGDGVEIVCGFGTADRREGVTTSGKMAVSPDEPRTWELTHSIDIPKDTRNR